MPSSLNCGYQNVVSLDRLPVQGTMFHIYGFFKIYIMFIRAFSGAHGEPFTTWFYLILKRGHFKFSNQGVVAILIHYFCRKTQFLRLTN